MGRGVRPPGAGPEMGSNRGPFLILACSWEGPPTTPIPPFSRCVPPDFDLQNLLKSTVNHLSRSSYADTPPIWEGGQ